MKPQEVLKLNYFSLRFRYLMSWLVVLVVPPIILGCSTKHPGLDYNILMIVFLGLMIYSFYLGIYQQRTINKSYLNIKCNRLNFVIGNIIVVLIHAIIQTLLFFVAITLLSNYWKELNIEANQSLTNILTYVYFFLVNIAFFTIGNLSYLFLRKYKVIFLLIFIVILLLAIFDVINIYTVITSLNSCYSGSYMYITLFSIIFVIIGTQVLYNLYSYKISFKRL